MTRFTPLTAALALILVATIAVDAKARESGTKSAIAIESSWDREERRSVQFALMLSSEYKGELDGIFGRQTRAAIRLFQKRSGEKPTGYLTASQTSRLEKIRRERVALTGFRVVRDGNTGLEIGLPLALLREPRNEDLVSSYEARRADFPIGVSLFNYAGDRAAFKNIYKTASTREDGQPVEMHTYTDTWFAAYEPQGDDRLYAEFYRKGLQITGFMVEWHGEVDAVMRGVARAMAVTFAPRSGKPPKFPSSRGKVVKAERAPAARSGTSSKAKLTATAFAVNARGYLLTNNHAVTGCETISFEDGERARIIASDPDLDLALALPVTDWRPPGAPIFRNSPARLGEGVAALGFPFADYLGGLNVTRGEISSLTGPKHDKRFLQISAPIQQGNAGGPLLDDHGQVIGVVKARLSTRKIVFATGDLPQNVNFAIRGDLALDFLEQQGVAVKAGNRAEPLSSADVAERGSKFTVKIECRPN